MFNKRPTLPNAIQISSSCVQVTLADCVDDRIVELQNGLIAKRTLEIFAQWTKSRTNVQFDLSQKQIRTTKDQYGFTIREIQLLLYNGKIGSVIPANTTVRLLYFDEPGMIFMIEHNGEVGWTPTANIRQQVLMTFYSSENEEERGLILEHLVVNMRPNTKIFTAWIEGEDNEWRQVAIKAKALKGEEDKIARDIALWKNLHHNNVAPLLSTFVYQRYMFFCMEKGDKLDCIKRSETEVFCILRDIAMGLRYLHRLGYIHLDLKLGNVVIVNGRAKIIDFESIYYFGRPATELASTVNIMPPEALGNDPDYILSNGWDVWSFGVIAFMLLAGYEKSWYYYCKKSSDRQKLFELINTSHHLEKINNWASECGKIFVRACINSDSKKRPSLNTIVDVIDSILERKREPIRSQSVLEPQSQLVMNIIVDNNTDLQKMIKFVSKTKGPYFVSLSTDSPDTVYNTTPLTPDLSLSTYINAYANNVLEDFCVTLWYTGSNNHYVYNIRLKFHNQFPPTKHIAKLWYNSSCIVVESGVPIICRYFGSIKSCIRASEQEIIMEIQNVFAFKRNIIDVTAILQMESLTVIERDHLRDVGRLFGFIVKGDLSTMPASFVYGLVFLFLDKTYSGNIPHADWVGLPNSVPITRFSYHNHTKIHNRENVLVFPHWAEDVNEWIATRNLNVLIVKAQTATFVQFVGNDTDKTGEVAQQVGEFTACKLYKDFALEGKSQRTKNTPTKRKSTGPTTPSKKRKK